MRIFLSQLWRPVVLRDLCQCLKHFRVSKLISQCPCFMKSLKCFWKFIVLTLDNSFQQSNVVLAGWVHYEPALYQLFKVAQSRCVLVHAKVSISSERVKQRTNHLVQMLFFTKYIQQLNSSFVLFFHYESGSIHKNLQFLNHFHVNIKWRSPLQSVSCSIKISNFNFELCNLIQSLGCGFFRCIEFDRLLVR